MFLRQFTAKSTSYCSADSHPSSILPALRAQRSFRQESSLQSSRFFASAALTKRQSSLLSTDFSPRSPTSHLRSVFSKEIGMSVTKYVRLKVLEAAEADLENDKLTVKEIANKYGFCDQFYFTRVFTEHFGQPPSKYRKKNI